MLRNFFLGTRIFLGFIPAYAQTDSTEKSPLPKITGSIDIYYRYNFNDPKAGGSSGDDFKNNYTSFTNSQNSFQLGMASIKANHSLGKASATLDLGFGPRAEEFSYGDPDHPTLFAVKQTYLSYAVSDKVKFTVGKWATHVGYEVTDAYLNRNYSMDYMFSYGPFSHTGLKADIELGGKSAFMIGIANSSDIVAEAGSRKYAIAQFSTATTNDKMKAYFNYQGSYGGSFSMSQFDLVLTGTVTDQFSMGYNGTVQTTKLSGEPNASWWGSAIYLNLDPTSTFGITLRGEYFDNKKGAASRPVTNLFDVTLSPNFKIGNLIIIPELRLDTAGNAIFEKSDNTSAKSTITGIVAAIYHF